jgi:hypothetical protein
MIKMQLFPSPQDQKTLLQYGEKGHIEYGWSKHIRERIMQFNFQLVRTTTDTMYKLQHIYHQLINELMFLYHFSTYPLDKEISMELLILLYKMIGQTRDIIDGKGEYTLSYMMIYVWFIFSPELACYALLSFIQSSNDSNEHPYGSWKDMKYFCNFCKAQDVSSEHFLIQYVIALINDQIKIDLEKVESNNISELSLVAKWVPREKSHKFGWLFNLLAMHFFPHYIESATTDESYRKARFKCNTDYRKIISLLNKHLDTIQINQCNKKWSQINFEKITSNTLLNQKSAFLNITKIGNKRTYYDDRILCAENFKKYIQQKDCHVKGERIGLNEFVKQAFELIKYGKNESEDFQLQKDLLNAQWRNHSLKNGTLGKMIAMVDVSCSMEGESMNAAIGLGIRVAEKSILGKRVMTFSASPTWVSLEDREDFISMVDKIQKAEININTNTNFYAALNKILDAIIETKMKPEEVQDLMLVVFSDMQMDEIDTHQYDEQGINNSKGVNKKSLYDNMKEKYEETGIRLYGKPFKPPHILFWNLRSTNGFPTVANQQNCSMISGFNSTLLNLFCEQGFDSLQACTPWALLVKSLENKRYEPLEKKGKEVLCSKN